MRKGQVPVKYIIAIILAIAIVAFIGYWFFILSGRWGGKLSETECKRRRLQYCQEWVAVGYDTAQKPEGGWNKYAPGCTYLWGSLKSSDCEEILGD